MLAEPKTKINFQDPGKKVSYKVEFSRKANSSLWFGYIIEMKHFCLFKGYNRLQMQNNDLKTKVEIVR